ncbi:MAG: hypothetical protein J6A15_07095 [Clostridia bacterium]|nr:hypothetical protein [Clostridia bacterium]
MDKNQPFFDPYNFNNMQNNIPQQTPMDPALDNLTNPMMYYEQQYMYYRYLTQVLEYKIKLKELEKLSKEQ